MIVVGAPGDQLVLALRRGNPQRLEFVSVDELRDDAQPKRIGADYDVVVVAVDVEGEGRELDDAAAVAGPRATLVAVVETSEIDLSTNGTGGESRHLDELRGHIERLEGRRSAVLRELVSCEQALSRSEQLAEDVHEEILMMRRTVSWRVTRPLRWVRAHAGRS